MTTKVRRRVADKEDTSSGWQVVEQKYIPGEKENVGDDNSEEEERPKFTKERLRELRAKVGARDIKSKADRIMYIYFCIILGFGIFFFKSLGSYGIDYTVELYIQIAAGILALAMVFHTASYFTDNVFIAAIAGMLAITGVPVLVLAVFVYVWVSMFFKHEWRTRWLDFI